MRHVCSSLIALVLLAAAGTAGAGDCGRPLTKNGHVPKASDALYILRSAIGDKSCRLGDCDVDSDCNIHASDALGALRGSRDGAWHNGCKSECPTSIPCEEAGAPICNGLCPQGQACAVAGAEGDKRVTICHVVEGGAGGTETIVVPASAVAAHLAHGDRLGACDRHDGGDDRDEHEGDDRGEHEGDDRSEREGSGGEGHEHECKPGDKCRSQADDFSVRSRDDEPECACVPLGSTTTSTTLVGPTTTTTLTAPTTTLPAPTTTLPAPTTTLPTATTTLPAPTTTLPAPTTTLPAPTTTLPAPTTTVPAPTTSTTMMVGGDPELGQVIYDNDCAVCHRAGNHDPSGFAPNLAGKGNKLVNNLGTIDSSMSGLTYNDIELSDLAAFFDSL